MHSGSFERTMICLWLRIFRLLLLLFPKDWRRAFSRDAEEMFSSQHAEVLQSSGHARAWWQALTACLDLIPRSLEVRLPRNAVRPSNLIGGSLRYLFLAAVRDFSQAVHWMFCGPVASPARLAIVAIAAAVMPSVFIGGLERASNTPPGIEDPKSLVVVRQAYAGLACCLLSAADVGELASFSQYARFVALRQGDFSIRGTGGAARVSGYWIQPGFFDLVGLQPVRGRLFDETDRGGDAVLASEQLARDLFDTESQVVGKGLWVDGRQRVVVGIVPDEFTAPGGPMLFLPLPAAKAARPQSITPSSLHRDAVVVLGRMKPGVEAQVLQRELEAARIGQSGRDPRIGIAVGSLRDWYMTPSIQGTLVLWRRSARNVLLAAIASVVALGWAMVDRLSREVRIRTVLGAPAQQVRRQVCLLGLLITGASCIVVVAVVRLGGRALLANLMPGLAGDALSIRVTDALKASIAPAAAVWMAFAIVTTYALARFLPAGRKPSRIRGRSGLRLVVLAQVALTTLMLCRTAALVTDWSRPGVVRPRRSGPTLVATLVRPDTDDPMDKSLVSHRRVLERLAAMEAVESIATSTPLFSLYADVRSKASHGTSTATAPMEVRYVDRRFFDTLDLGAPIDALAPPGARWASGRQIVAIDKTAARLLFGDETPVGRTITSSGLGESWAVAAVVRSTGAERSSDAAIYLPLEASRERRLTYVLRVNEVPLTIAEIRRAVNDVAPDVVVLSLENLRGKSAFRSDAFSALTAFHVLTALIGALIASLVSCSLVEMVARDQADELRVRRALGATSQSVFGLVLLTVSRPWAAGLAVGSVGAMSLGDELPWFVHTTPTSPSAMLPFIFPLMAAIFLLGVASLHSTEAAIAGRSCLLHEKFAE